MGQTAGKPTKRVDPLKPLAKKKSSSNRDPPPPYTSANAKIITTDEIQTDATILTWNTKNFTKLRQLTPKKEELTRSFPFKAGEGTPTPTNWSLNIRINKKKELQFRLNLESTEPEQDPTKPVVYEYEKKGNQKAFAYFTPSVKDPKDPTKIFFYKSVGLCEYVVDEYRHLSPYAESKRWVKLATMKQLKKSGALMGDILSIGIHLEIYHQTKSVPVTSTINKMGETSGYRHATPAFKEMGHFFEELFKSGTEVDVNLRVRKKHIFLHIQIY